MLAENIKSNTPMRQPPADYCPPESANWFVIPSGDDAGKTMFYSDCRVGSGEPIATIVFVHGNPECSYTYRHIRDALIVSGQPMRLIAMDHIGFGLSDQADFEMVDMHHAANLKHLIAHLDLTDVSLVVHDWGGPIGIGAFIDQPERVRNLLVMNTTVFPMALDGMTYKNYPFRWLPWSGTPYWVPARLWGGVAAYVVSHAAPQSAASFVTGVGRSCMRFVRAGFEPGSPEYVWSEPLRTRINALSSMRNVYQAARWGHGYRYRDARHGWQDTHDFHAGIQSRIADVWGEQGRNIAVCGYFGGWDPCGQDSVVAQWHAALPRMREHTHRFPKVGHFIEEYKGPEMAASLLAMNLEG